MSKRSADKQITKDNDEVEEEVYEQGTTWKKASKDALAKREIVSVRRKKETGENKPVMPTFDFGVAAATESKTETKEETPAAAAPAEAAPAAPAPAVNAFAKFMKKEGEWDCASCEVRNPKENSKCRACEEPRAGAAAEAPAPVAAAAAPVNNAFAKFMKKADEWECASCLVTNKVGLAKCAACETPNPAAEASEKKEEAAPSGFSFGVDSSSSSSSETPQFTFGGDNAQFSFSADTPFTFGTGFGETGAMSFGSVASESDKDAFKASGDVNAFDESATVPDASSETSAVFKGRQAEVTGDEEDTVVHKTMCKVFQLAKVEPAQESELPVDDDAQEKPKPKEDKAADEGAKMSFQERGTGELNVLTREKDGKHTSRLLLRANQTHRLVLNAPIYQGIKATLEEKFIRMVSMDLEQKMSTFLLKFKNKQEASTVLNHILKLSEKKA